MTSFSIDKQHGQVNAEWMSRPVDSLKNQTKNQPLALVLISMAQSPTFAYRLKRKLLSGPIFGEAYKGILHDRKDGKAIYKIGSDTVDTKNAIAVEFSDVFMLLNTFEGGLNNKKLKIRGTFNKNNRGPKKKFAGTVEDATIVSE